MLKEAGLSHMLDTLDREREQRDHQRDEVLECTCGIRNSRSDVFITKQKKTDQRSAGERAEKHWPGFEYCESWSSLQVGEEFTKWESFVASAERSSSAPQQKEHDERDGEQHESTRPDPKSAIAAVTTYNDAARR